MRGPDTPHRLRGASARMPKIGWRRVVLAEVGVEAVGAYVAFIPAGWR